MRDARFEGEGNDGLAYGRNEEGPCPLCVWYIHFARTTGRRGKLSGETLAMVISAGLRLVRLLLAVGRVVVGLVGIVAVQRLASEEGCSGLVVRNFGRMSAATGG